MPSYFVTATGTDIGKTFVTCGLIEALRHQNHDVTAIKPLISGWDDADTHTDTHQLIASLGLEVTHKTIEAVSPWRFKAALSPDMAARLEGRDIDFNQLQHFCMSHKASHSNDIRFIEGAGGVMVPVTKQYLTSDLIKALDMPAILVAGTYLGTLSHTLTAYFSLKHQAIRTKCLVLSESEQGVDIDETVASLKPWISEPIFIIPRMQEPNPLFWQPIIEHLIKD